MNPIKLFKKKTKYINKDADSSNEHEFCPRCEANITMQKGYSNDLSYWICRGCGEKLEGRDYTR